MKPIHLIIAFIISLNTLAQEKVMAYSENKKTENAFNLDEFYFTHQLFSEAVYMTRLNKELTIDEIFYMLYSVLYKVDLENDVYIEIDRPGQNAAKFNFSVVESPKARVLLMQTNFDADTSTFVEEISDSTWMRFYVMSGDMLIHNNDLYSPKAEEEAKNGNTYTLIGFYMFDDKKDNDDKIKPLIDNILNDPKSDKIDLLYTKLYLGEYYLMKSDLVAAEKEVNSLKEFFKQHKGNGIPENYAVLTDMAETELRLMQIFQAAKN